jgi:hypothetical protein
MVNAALWLTRIEVNDASTKDNRHRASFLFLFAKGRALHIDTSLIRDRRIDFVRVAGISGNSLSTYRLY